MTYRSKRRGRILRNAGWLALLIVVGSCAAEIVEDPMMDYVPYVDRIDVQPLLGEDKDPFVVTDPETLDLVAHILWDPRFWVENEYRLQPYYRLEARTASGQVATYWIGYFSATGAFPCYGLCSGYWAALPGNDGRLDPTRIKAIATERRAYAMSRLLQPDELQPSPWRWGRESSE